MYKSRQQISRGHIGKLLDKRQNNWENFLYNKTQPNQTTGD